MSYQFFGSGPIQHGEDPMSETTQEVDKEVIEYYMLDIDREVVNNPLEYLDYRFNEIERKKEEKKKTETKTFSYWLPKEANLDSEFFNRDVYKKKEPKELPLFEEMPDTSEADVWYPDNDKIKSLVAVMVSCAFNLNTKSFDTKQWVIKHMEKRYKELFKSEEEMEEWADMYTEFLMNHYDETGTPEEVLEDFDSYQTSIAMALIDELNNYVQYCKYIKLYINSLERFIL